MNVRDTWFLKEGLFLQAVPAGNTASPRQGNDVCKQMSRETPASSQLGGKLAFQYSVQGFDSQPGLVGAV